MPDLHEPFDKLLKENVRDERVDYLNIRDQRRSDLKAYLDDLAAVEVADLDLDEQLAFYINLYNATVVLAVVERYRPGYTVSEYKYKLFYEQLVRLGDRRISLNDLEHKIIRPTFKDPRIHAAVVCAAVSCPTLLPRAYRTDGLDEMLHENMDRFLYDTRRNRIDYESSRLELSKIFQWYAEDFGGEENLAKYVKRYTEIDTDAATVSFMEYSWELNIVLDK